jgi:hypothetical protein
MSVEKNSWFFSSYQIAYEYKLFQNYVEQILKIFMPKLVGCNNIPEAQYLVSAVTSCFFPLLPHLKHSDYDIERECRFVLFEKSPTNKEGRKINPYPQAAERSYFLRPNKKENNQFVNPIPTIIGEVFDKDIIAEIGIGPACNKDQAEFEVRKLLKENGFDDTKIHIYPSEKPYRR